MKPPKAAAHCVALEAGDNQQAADMMRGRLTSSKAARSTTHGSAFAA